MNSINTIKIDPAIEGRVKSPEQGLFIAILGQAVHDAFSGRVFRIERDEARNFLTRNSKDFRIICEMAGKEPQYVLEKIRKRAKKNWTFPEVKEFIRKPPRQKKHGKSPERGRRKQR